MISGGSLFSAMRERNAPNALPANIGRLVILRSNQLKAAQDGVHAISGLAIVLPLLSFLLFALAIGHLCAALFYHYMIRKDQILQRMVPGTDVSQQGVEGPAT